MERYTIKNSMGIAVYKTPFECEKCHDSLYRLPDYGNGSPTDHLAEYEDLEEQGLLLKLLCKVGDKVWIITTPANYSLGKYSEVTLKKPQEKKIQSITIAKNGVLYHVKDRTYCEQDFGKTIFLTQAEADEALRSIDIKEFAQMLDNRQYGYPQFTKAELQIAKDNGFVIVCGAFDDLMEFHGAIYNYASCYEGGKAYFDKTGMVLDEEFENSICIEALRFKEDDIKWTYKTNIPHETFMIYEDDEKYCRGIVFRIEDIN